MQKLLTTILSITLAFNAIGQSDTRTKVLNHLKEIEPKVIEWRHDLHQNPELSNREFRTAKIIAKHLRDLGMEVQEGVAHTGVVGVLKGGKPGPVVALRADMDALPVTERVDIPWASKVTTEYNGKTTGVMHACGHDTHVATLMGVAEALAKVKKELKGTVKFIFQPAEEGAPVGEEGGAELMVKEGVLEYPKVDVIFGLHINASSEVGEIGYKEGGMLASACDFKVVVEGKSSHGAAPWESVDPILTASQIVTALHTIVSRNLDLTANGAVITVGAINGGNRSNIIPETVEMLGTLRTLSKEDTETCMRRIQEVVENSAKAMGAKATVQIPYSTSYPVTYNDPKLTRMMAPSLVKATGAEQVSVVNAITGAEDFSFFAENVPGLFFWIGGMPKGMDAKDAAPHHTPDFFVDDAGMMTGMKAFTHLVLDYFEMEE